MMFLVSNSQPAASSGTSSVVSSPDDHSSIKSEEDHLGKGEGVAVVAVWGARVTFKQE